MFAVLLAYEAGLTDASLEHEAAKLEAYDAAVADEQGATMIAGVMSDRATDRHARAVLRQATALGRFEPARALGLGVIDATDLADAQARHHVPDILVENGNRDGNNLTIGLPPRTTASLIDKLPTEGQARSRPAARGGYMLFGET